MLSLHSFSGFVKFSLLAGSLSLAGCASGTSSSNVGSSEPQPASQTEQSTPSEVVSVTTRSKAHVTRTGEVYLMRGLLNVFSRGMDEIAVKMRRKGMDAISYNHGNWLPIADDIVARAKKGEVSYPIIIMGHSLGGNEAPNMANFLANRGIKVSYVVAFDPTEPGIVGKNIDRVTNYYLPNGKNTISKGSGFNGKLTNVNVSSIPDIKHTNVEKNPKLQSQAISQALKYTKPLPKKRKSKKRVS